MARRARSAVDADVLAVPGSAARPLRGLRLVLFAVLLLACLGKLVCWAIVIADGADLEQLWRPMLFLTVLIVLDLLVLFGLKLAVGPHRPRG